MQKKLNTVIFTLITLIGLGSAAAMLTLGGRYYYISAALIAVGAVVPFFVSFERKKAKTREIAAIACIVAAAVVSRGAFYMLPQVKPIAAVVIIAAVSFGAETGFLTGALSMLLSDFFFGIGAWTPFQMLGLGLVGLVCGVVFTVEGLRKNRFVFGLLGGLTVFFVYGFIADMSSVLMLAADFTPGSIFAIYAAGAPFNAIFAATTALLLTLVGGSMTEKLERVKVKYGLFERRKSE